MGRLLTWAIVGILASPLVACGGEADEGSACSFEAWEQCPKPSAESLSMPWPELRARLAALADATEEGVAAPEAWHVPLTRIDVLHDAPFMKDWSGPVSQQDKERRSLTRQDVDATFAGLFNALANLHLSRSKFNVKEAVDSAREAEKAFATLKAESLFQDPFGRPEPRTTLVSYARGATVLQFLVRTADQRRRIADDASAFLNERLGEWEEMQRGRLAGRPEAELQAAIDEFGKPEIARLVTAWRKIEALDIRPISE
ncbi:MAG: hypothetical protein KF850_09070 [Labilithrix sp.]|nr:hypothetical protein [Labilithrix sp.]MBX3212170.1 hypothetical protein [Labilithrix sp.]